MLSACCFKKFGPSLTPFPVQFPSFPSSCSLSPVTMCLFQSFYILFFYSYVLPTYFFPLIPNLLSFSFHLLCLLPSNSFLPLHSHPFSPLLFSSASSSLLAYCFPITRTLTILLTLPQSLFLSLSFFSPSLPLPLPPSSLPLLTLALREEMGEMGD